MSTYRHIIFLIAIVAPFLSFNIDSVAPCLLSRIDGDVDLLSSDYRGVKSEGRDGATGQWKEMVHKESGIVLRLVPAGEFDMGSHISAEEVARKYGGEAAAYKDEHPLHRVKISEPFYIGKYEVTNEQFCKFLNAKAAHSCGGNIWLGLDGKDCRIEKRGGEYRPKSGYVGHPVTNVSWWGAKAFSEWVGGRLPSEAEWEYSCRAGSMTVWCFGDDETRLGDYVWHYENSGKKTHEVGTRKPNAWGLYDMYGNVGEWCEDVQHDNYNGAPDDGSAWTTGGEQSSRVLRGGTWGYNARYIRSAHRLFVFPGIKCDKCIGFRVVVAAEAVR